MSMANLKPFLLEEYLEEREFAPGHMFCGSDLETRTVGDLLAMSSEEDKVAFEKLPLNYTVPAGHPELRSEIAQMYSGLKTEEVVCFAGAEEGIFCAMHALLEAGDHVVVLTPTYQSLYSVAEGIGCSVTKVDLHVAGERWILDPSAIEKSLRPNTKLIVINFPNNPTGLVPPVDVYREIFMLAAKHGCYVFSDEVYRHLEFEEAARLPAACELYSGAFSLGVVSKSFGLAGLRIGWVASKEKKLLQKMIKLKHYLSICSSAPSEFLALLAVRHRETLHRENRAIVLKNYALLRDYFRANTDMFQWIEADGGSVAYPSYCGPGTVWDFAEHLYAEARVVILPSRIFEDYRPNFRVSFGRKNTAETLEIFANFVERFEK